MDLNEKLNNNLLSNKKEYDEELTSPENNRLTIYPIKYKEVWEMYKKQLAAFWTAEEIDFSRDYNDFQKLNTNEQNFIKMVLAFFSSSDTIVNINLEKRFQEDVTLREVKVCYTYQQMIENIHSEVYSLQIDNIIKDEQEKHKLFNAVKNFECIREKTDWAVKWIESDDSFGKRLIAFAIVEGVFFSGSFCSIFWLKKKNLMPGLISSNELIARDEGMHTNFAILLYNMLKNRIDEKEIHDMFKEAVEIESKFINEALQCRLLGMNSELMNQYIKYVADRLLLQLNYNKIWNVSNPFDFMEYISLEGKTNFFEHRPTQYQRADVLNKTKNYNFSDDF
jgi:ribonucleotide reductase beta subunit family protein with ferritin-like domain